MAMMIDVTTASLAAVRAEYTNGIDPARALAAETLQLERTLSDLIHQAYGLTPEEVQLMWVTAPPRMPFTVPAEPPKPRDFSCN